jgi:hypothetical protein
VCSKPKRWGSTRGTSLPWRINTNPFFRGNGIMESETGVLRGRKERGSGVIHASWIGTSPTIPDAGNGTYGRTRRIECHGVEAVMKENQMPRSGNSLPEGESNAMEWKQS